MKIALTAQELMRSRYEAFKSHDWQYLEDTSLKQKAKDFSDLENIQWLKLDVLHVEENVVEFKAYFKESGILQVLHERSNFIHKDGLWFYIDGILFNSKIERNETCPCGSGKKYKKCCG